MGNEGSTEVGAGEGPGTTTSLAGTEDTGRAGVTHQENVANNTGRSGDGGSGDGRLSATVLSIKCIRQANQ